MFKNCKLAKIEQDIGEHWNEQGVAVGTVNSMFNNCNLAKIEQDLGEQWNEQVSLDTNNCNLAKICNHPSPRAWARLLHFCKIAILQHSFPRAWARRWKELRKYFRSYILPARVGVPKCPLAPIGANGFLPRARGRAGGHDN